MQTGSNATLASKGQPGRSEAAVEGGPPSHGKRHPNELTAAQVREFLTGLGVRSPLDGPA